MSKFIEIDGFLIRKDVIQAVGRIVSDTYETGWNEEGKRFYCQFTISLSNGCDIEIGRELMLTGEPCADDAPSKEAALADVHEYHRLLLDTLLAT